MTPFFLKSYVRSHAHDVFEQYAQLLTEMSLRLPYQMKKVADANDLKGSKELLGRDWQRCLCEYMMTSQTPYVRRQVKVFTFL